MWTEYINAHSIEQATQILAAKGGAARLIAGGTDLMLELERGLRPDVQTLVDISRIPALTALRWMKTA